MIFSQRKRPYAPAILGLCRAGASVSSIAERIAPLASTASEQGSDRELDVAVYVALARMGRGDIVEREKAKTGRFSRVHASVIERCITPEGPPGICSNEAYWPRVPD